MNYKLSRLNSRFWNPGSEGVDAFVMVWAGENNYICPSICLIPRVLLHLRSCKASATWMDWAGENNYICPSICLIPRVLLYLRSCKASATLIVPLWPSAPFSPMIYDGDHFYDFVVSWIYLLPKKPSFQVDASACLVLNGCLP